MRSPRSRRSDAFRPTGADPREQPLDLTETLDSTPDQWSADAAHALQPEMAAERGADGRRAIGDAGLEPVSDGP